MMLFYPTYQVVPPENNLFLSEGPTTALCAEQRGLGRALRLPRHLQHALGQPSFADALVASSL